LPIDRAELDSAEKETNEVSYNPEFSILVEVDGVFSYSIQVPAINICTKKKIVRRPRFNAEKEFTKIISNWSINTKQKRKTIRNNLASVKHRRKQNWLDGADTKQEYESFLSEFTKWMKKLDETE
jgi:DNA phosphorothioation-dependent restriction protein DptG